MISEISRNVLLGKIFPYSFNYGIFVYVAIQSTKHGL